MWNVNYPDVPVERVFNFSPKDWRGPKPTYNLKDQTESVNAKKLPYLLALATIEDEKRDNTMTIVRGVLDLDNGKIADNILSLSLAELIKTKATEKDAPEQAGNAPEAEQAPEAPKKAVNRTKSAGKGNTQTEPGKPVKTENKEKQLIRAGGAPTPYDVCDKYCHEKNCDYCLGEHGDPCIEAKARAGYIEPESDRLPWEHEQTPAVAPAPDPEPEKQNLLFDEIEL